MSSVAQQINIPGQLVDFRPRRYSYTLLNSKRRPHEARFDGTLITVPPVHQVGPLADTDASGRPIPGSRVIEDIYIPVPEISDEVLIFNARTAVVHILGLQFAADGDGHVATSAHAHAGLSLLPRHPHPELWQETAAAGEQRVFLARVKAAQALTDEFANRNGQLKANGLAPLTPGRDYYEAVELLKQYGELIKEEVAEVLAPHQEDALEAEVELEAMVRARAIALAESALKSAGVDDATAKAKLIDSLLQDPKVRQLVQKDYRIRKRGHRQPTSAELEKAVAAGSATVDGDGDSE